MLLRDVERQSEAVVEPRVGTQTEMAAFVCRQTERLSGVVRLSGSKNVGLKLLTTTPMFQQPVTLKALPRNSQIRFVLDLLRSFGANVRVDADTEDGLDVTVHVRELSRHEFEYHEFRHCRHVFLLAVSVLLRTGRVIIHVPGYSHYGPRLIDPQLEGLRQLGARVSPIEHGQVRIELPEGGLRAQEIFLAFPSNAVTEALVYAAVATKGCTVLHGAAQEPETMDILRFFERAGACIERVGNAAIQIESMGLDTLISPSATEISPDRIEAATFGAAISICGGEIRVQRASDDRLASIRAILNRLGTQVHSVSDGWLLRAEDRPRATDITTGPFPAFPTDAQGPFMAVLSLAQGVSILQERLWFNRLSLAGELRRLGAAIDVPNPQLAVIRGVQELSGAAVVGTDPRATAALVLAGLKAKGETFVVGVDLLDSAYDSLDVKLRHLGADICRTHIRFSEYALAHPVLGRLEAF